MWFVFSTCTFLYALGMLHGTKLSGRKEVYAMALLYCIIAFFISFPASWYDIKQKLAGIEEVRESVELARQNNEFEKAALQHKIIEANQAIAEYQYRNTVLWFCMWVPDEVDEVKLIK